MQWIAIGLGAAIGACLRAWLGKLNSISYSTNDSTHAWLPSWLPLGTLSANVLGGFLIGMALVVFLRFGETLHPNVRLFVITGFLGGLTTFSSFSAEVFGLLSNGRVFAGLGLVGLHVGLTLIATAIGFYLIKAVL